MGLLDQIFGNADQTQALGLLGANMMAGNTANGFAQAQGLLAGADDRRLAAEYKRMQMEGLKSEIEQRKALQQRAEDDRQFNMRLFNGGAPQSGPSGGVPAPAPLGGGSPAGFPTGSPSNPAAQATQFAQSPQGSFLASLNEDQVTALIAMKRLPPGAEKLWEIAKFGKDYKQGDFRVKSDGSQSMVPMVKDGLGYGPGGVSVLPGAAESQQQLTLANELAKAAASSAGRVNLRKNADGTESPVTELSENTVMQRYLGGGNRAPAQSQGPAGATQIAPDEQRARDGESIRIIQSEISRERDPSVRAALQRELGRMQSAQARPGFPAASAPQGYGKTTAQTIAEEAAKTKAVKDAEAASGRDATMQKGAVNSRDTLGYISEARQLLKKGPTASGIGSAMDAGASFFGQSTKGADAAAQLDTLSGWMVSNVPRMEGPQSNFDVQNYKTMAALVGDRTKPISQRIAALDTLERLQQKYASLNGEAPNSGASDGDWAPTGKQSSMSSGGWSATLKK